jgi:hypothetical protein
MVMSSVRLRTKNDCAGEDQLPFAQSDPNQVSYNAVSWDSKYGHESQGMQNQQWVCWWRPEAT